jgi:hypothetical protein
VSKRFKAKAGLVFIPTAYSFSEIEASLPEGAALDDVLGDSGVCDGKMVDDFAMEQLILQVLYNLDEREKIIFCYQLLRDNGYQIKHGAFAKTIGINRQRYMVWLKRVRDKAKAVITQEKNQNNKDK